MSSAMVPRRLADPFGSGLHSAGSISPLEHGALGAALWWMMGL